jgi:hypothetical protein
MNHKFSGQSFGKTQEYATLIAEEISKLWDNSIRQVLVNQGWVPEGFDPMQHAKTLSRSGLFCYQPDGTKEFRWNDKKLLVGGWIDGKMSNGYAIKPV